MTTLFSSRTRVTFMRADTDTQSVRIMTLYPEILAKIHQLLLNPQFVNQAIIQVELVNPATLVVRRGPESTQPDDSFVVAFAAALLATKAKFISPTANAALTFSSSEFWIDANSQSSLEKFTPYFKAYRQLK